MARFIVAPQWQGSSSSRALQLIDGAEAIAGDLPRSSTTVLVAPMEAGDAQGTRVHRLSALVRMRERIEEAVRSADDPAIVIGGDCGVALGAVSAIAGDDLAVVWIDAHPDLNTPDSSPSGAFTGMVLRAIAGEGETLLRLDPGIDPARLVLVAARAWDPGEEAFAAAHGITVVRADDLASPDALADAVVATGAGRAHVHVDLDALDPAEMGGVAQAVPFGARTADVVASIRRLRERLPLAGATLTEFSPASPTAAVDDLGTILRVIGALA